MKRVLLLVPGLLALAVPLAALAAEAVPQKVGIRVESAPLTGGPAEVTAKVAEALALNGYARLAKDAWKKTEDETCSLFAHVTTIQRTVAQMLTCRLSMTALNCGTDGEETVTKEVTAIMRAVASP